MRSDLTRAAVAAAAIAALSPFASNAGWHHPHSIRFSQADLDPDRLHFGCETRVFVTAVPCYGPEAIRAAYKIDQLLNAGSNGSGHTIVILDAFGSPNAASDLAAFDNVFGVPAPPSFTVVTMPGTPAFNPADDNMVGWAEEVSLDVQWAHAIAPGANIVLVAAKSNSDDDLVAGLNFAIDNRLGDVISMSFGESEADLTDADGRRIVKEWEKAFARADARHITLFVSSGDDGSANCCDANGNLVKSVSFPASSPRVTGVGGTNLFFGIGNHAQPADVSPAGTYLGEAVWNDGFGASGGGVSVLFKEPGYQHENLPKAVQKTLNGHRGVPDVAYNGGVRGGVIVHLGPAITDALGIPTNGAGAFFIFGGTSAGAPQWSGIIVDVNQQAGRSIGFINKRLYELGGSGALSGLFHDVTTGNNAFAGFAGFSAAGGWDPTTGWGTPNFGSQGTVLSHGDGDDQDDFGDD